MRPAIKITGIIFIAAWAAMMFKSTSFVFVYILVALAGIASIILDKQGNNRHRALPVIVGILLSGAVILANYGLFGSIFHNKILIILSAAVAFAGGFAAFSAIARAMIGAALSGKCLKTAEHRFRPGAIFFFVMAVIAIIDLAVLFLAYYPGIISPDSVNQISQTYSGVYSNHHPVVHTMIIKGCMELGNALAGSANAGVCIYSVVQIMVMSACFAYVIMTLYQMELSYRLLIPVFVCFALLPYNIMYSFTMWKDVMFGGAMAVFVTVLLRLIRHIGVRKGADHIVLVIASFGVCLLRSNGWMAFLATLVIAVCVFGRKCVKTLVIMAAVLIISLAVRGPIFSALGISKPDILESLAIPMQQIARVLSEGEEITEEQREILSRIADPDMVAEKYRWDTVDTFKDDIRQTGDPDYINEHKGELIRLYIDMARQHPVTFIEAWIDQTKGYWNGGYSYWNWTVINENEFGIERVTVSQPLADAMEAYTDAFSRIFILQPFVSIGLCTWIIVILAAAGLAARRKETILAVPGIIIVLTLMIATPISCEFRYAYSLFTAFPVIFCGIMLKSPEK